MAANLAQQQRTDEEDDFPLVAFAMVAQLWCRKRDKGEKNTVIESHFHCECTGLEEALESGAEWIEELHGYDAEKMAGLDPEEWEILWPQGVEIYDADGEFVASIAGDGTPRLATEPRVVRWNDKKQKGGEKYYDPISGWYRDSRGGYYDDDEIDWDDRGWRGEDLGGWSGKFWERDVFGATHRAAIKAAVLDYYMVRLAGEPFSCAVEGQ